MATTRDRQMELNSVSGGVANRFLKQRPPQRPGQSRNATTCGCKLLQQLLATLRIGREAIFSFNDTPDVTILRHESRHPGAQAGRIEGSDGHWIRAQHVDLHRGLQKMPRPDVAADDEAMGCAPCGFYKLANEP